MLLKNLINLFTTGINRKGEYFVTLRGGGKLNVKYSSPQSSLTYSKYAMGVSHGSTSTDSLYLNALCIGIGTGTTPANYLDSDLETGGVAIETGTAQITDGKIIISAAYTPTEDTTITEIGSFAGQENYSSYSYGIMLTRTVFDTPVIIKANTTKTFSITIDCNKFSEGYTIN